MQAVKSGQVVDWDALERILYEILYVKVCVQRGMLVLFGLPVTSLQLVSASLVSDRSGQGRFAAGMGARKRSESRGCRAYCDTKGASRIHCLTPLHYHRVICPKPAYASVT